MSQEERLWVEAASHAQRAARKREIYHGQHETIDDEDLS
jgi:hypothetical protein